MDTTKTKQKRGLSRLIEIAGTKRWLLFGSMLFAIVSSVLQFVPFICVYKILVELAGNATTPDLIDSNIIWHWSYIALGAFIGLGLSMFVSLMLSHIAAFNILYELRMQLTKKMVKLSLGFFTKRASGELKKILSDDIERIELFVAHHIPDITSAVVFPLLLEIYMFIVDWRLALIVTGVFVLALGFMATMMSGKKGRAHYEKYFEAMGRMNNSIVQYVRGIQIVKTFTRSTEAYRQLNADIHSYREFSIDISRVYAPTYLGFYILLQSTLLFVIPVAIWLLNTSPSYTAYIPTVLLFIIFAGGIFFPVLKLMWVGGYMRQNTMGVGLIDEILNKPEISEPDTPQHPQDASVVFDNVSFSYGNMPTLQHISFTAPPGSVTALVGPSGAGKSTIAMLTARFWDVAEGVIRIGNAPIAQVATSELMNHVAFVFQENMLFFDTIEENIRMGNKQASMDQVKAAARAAQCDEFIEQLPNGYNTLVGEGGTYLSGGEQQRIALARAVLKDAPIILLDEATAYADPENEGKILEAFGQLIKGKTVIVIAHRLSTIINADQILYIDGGEIKERGTHQNLIDQGGAYAHMWETYNRSRDWVLRAQ